VQKYEPVPTDRRQADAQYESLRVTFDFSKVDANGKSKEQQDYVKGLINRAGQWLQAALKVRRVTGNLMFERSVDENGNVYQDTQTYPDCGDVKEVPQAYVTQGAANTDVLIFVLSDEGDDDTHSCHGGGTLAYATHCRQDSQERPVVGYIQMCAVHHEPYKTTEVVGSDDIVREKTIQETEEDFHTGLHEIMHILGMSDALFPWYRDFNGDPRNPRCPDPSSIVNRTLRQSWKSSTKV